ncbi:unnamed protein product [Vitrella brassicaformis CCMP3155]|uniref:FCP1 homology domain-containing protein n=3 Tax=Vitrella brassicaformis TaxID=1169539 RepID=A0A0G4F548_VITBC|nr:unnamed protein product [Vitrella brassicaformis CCMP3155]|eukprot:CEM07611.1 unnamed protein product [Vitrella brassicaformis CCMP3155]
MHRPPAGPSSSQSSVSSRPAAASPRSPHEPTPEEISFIGEGFRWQDVPRETLLALEFISTLPKNCEIHPNVPNALPPSSSDRKTLLLDMDETLTHTQFESLEHPHDMIVRSQEDDSWAYVYFRPYIREFLKTCANLFEVVCYTAANHDYADQIIAQLDPNNEFFSHRLYRYHCVEHRGYYIKDLRLLGRPLSHLILIDNSLISFAFQPDNGIFIHSFLGDSTDQELLQTLPILHVLVSQPDVRPLLRRHQTLKYIIDEYTRQRQRGLIADSLFFPSPPSQSPPTAHGGATHETGTDDETDDRHEQHESVRLDDGRRERERERVSGGAHLHWEAPPITPPHVTHNTHTNVQRGVRSGRVSPPAVQPSARLVIERKKPPTGGAKAVPAAAAGNQANENEANTPSSIASTSAGRYRGKVAAQRAMMAKSPSRGYLMTGANAMGKEDSGASKLSHRLRGTLMRGTGNDVQQQQQQKSRGGSRSASPRPSGGAAAVSGGFGRGVMHTRGGRERERDLQPSRGRERPNIGVGIAFNQHTAANSLQQEAPPAPVRPRPAAAGAAVRDRSPSGERNAANRRSPSPRPWLPYGSVTRAASPPKERANLGFSAGTSYVRGKGMVVDKLPSYDGIAARVTSASPRRNRPSGQVGSSPRVKSTDGRPSAGGRYTTYNRPSTAGELTTAVNRPPRHAATEGELSAAAGGASGGGVGVRRMRTQQPQTQHQHQHIINRALPRPPVQQVDRAGTGGVRSDATVPETVTDGH